MGCLLNSLTIKESTNEKVRCSLTEVANADFNSARRPSICHHMGSVLVDGNERMRANFLCELGHLWVGSIDILLALINQMREVWCTIGPYLGQRIFLLCEGSWQGDLSFFGFCNGSPMACLFLSNLHDVEWRQNLVGQELTCDSKLELAEVKASMDTLYSERASDNSRTWFSCDAIWREFIHLRGAARTSKSNLQSHGMVLLACQN